MAAPVVLLVEDDEDNLRINSTFLTHVGYRVIEATAAEPGIAADQTRAVEAGCDGYIAKPADPRTVLEELRRRVGEGART